ncbi:DUF2807 domain-containing protein [Dysgonomonas sp. OttesenSCG-928-D17]|nr:DUF2807 domain-containing protein [Dysgonomonas sp. OttesenSCG-928-D17]
MKTRNVLLMMCCVVSLGISAQVVKEKQTVTSFDKIASSSGIDVYFTQGNSYSLEIETVAENMPKIDVTVKEGKLELKRKKGENFARNTQIKAYVTAPTLSAIGMSGGADFSAQKLAAGKSINIAASGGADVEIDDLSADECKIAFSGGADCEIKRFKGKNLTLAFSGGSDGKVSQADVDNLTAAASGGADLIISGNVKNAIVSASGGADINISQLTAGNVVANKSGGGDIKR